MPESDEGIRPNRKRRGWIPRPFDFAQGRLSASSPTIRSSLPTTTRKRQNPPPTPSKGGEGGNPAATRTARRVTAPYRQALLGKFLLGFFDGVEDQGGADGAGEAGVVGEIGGERALF